MLAANSSGLVGLGSRLFFGEESDWGTAATTWKGFNIYNQPGSRPQKTMTTIDVPQLFPSMLRRKPLSGATSIAGSYVFGLPKKNFAEFAQLVLGDDSATTEAGASTAIAAPGNAVLKNVDADSDTRLVLQVTDASARTVGEQVILSGFTTGDTDDTDELESINRVHTIDTAVNGGINETLNEIRFTTATAFNLSGLTTVDVGDQDDGVDFAGGSGIVSTVTTTANRYDMQSRNNKSWTMIQTLGIERLARYTGMQAQTATLNVTGDSVVTMDIAFLGKDESVLAATDSNANTLFGGTAPLTISSGEITAVNSGYDNFVDYYPSWSAKLYLAKKPSAGAVDGFTSIKAGSEATDIEAEGFIIPFSDMSITINNALDFPAYINGTKTRNQPVQTAYKEVTGSMTIPFNEHTEALIDGHFNQDHYKAVLAFQEPGTSVSVKVDLPEFCVVGDGGLGTVPEGEITLPISFGAYASVTGSAGSEVYSTAAPISFIVDEATS